MKICLINSLYQPYSRGGAEVIFENIVNGLRAAGHEIIVITIKPFEGLSSFAPVGGVSEDEVFIYRFFPLNIFSFININHYNIFCRLIWHKLDIFNLHSYFVIRNILKKEKPSVVMTHNLKGIGYLIPRAIKKSKIKWVHTVHDVQLSIPSGLVIYGQENNLEQRIFLRKWYEKICRWLFDSPDVLVSPSKWLLDFYSEKGFFRNSKKTLMPNPIVGLRSGAYSNLKNHSPFTFLYLGQIEEHKGILFLIKVFKEFLDFQSLRRHSFGASETSIFNLELIVAGGGSKLEEIKKIAADEPRIKILGSVPHKQISEIFGRADFTIVPSLCYENSPTVIYESFSLGVPAIAARIGGAAELVKDGVNGFTFEAGKGEDLLRALIVCLENKERLGQMKVEALKSVEEYGIDKYIIRLINVISEL